jgi:hypothetical protein
MRVIRVEVQPDGRSGMLVSMPKLEILHRDDGAPQTGYAAGHDAVGVVESRRLQPPDYSLWVCTSELREGGEVLWKGDRAEEAIYVQSGSIEIDGRECPADGAVILESGVHARVRALGPTELVHFGPRSLDVPSGGEYGPPSPEGHGVHVVGPGGRFCSGSREASFARWYADSTCPTCRLCLIQVERTSPRLGPAHHHSEDEIIFVIGGAVGLGDRWLEEGSALFISRDARYRIRTGEAGYRFLNYRRDLSYQVYDTEEPPQLESALARGGSEVGDLR